LFASIARVARTRGGYRKIKNPLFRAGLLAELWFRLKRRSEPWHWLTQRARPGFHCLANATQEKL